MKQTRISKRPRSDRSWLEALPLDARDPDVVRAKRLARQAGPAQRRPQPRQD
jgi:hypothetical protein